LLRCWRTAQRASALCVRDDHPELCWDHVEPLRGVLADHMHGRAAARAIRVFRLDRHIEARQMKRAAIDAALLARIPASRPILFIISSFVRRDGLLDILERQQQLLGIELLRTPAELRTLQLPQKVLEPIVLQECLVALGDRKVTLGSRRRKQRMQGFDVSSS
jgi:hypothetical protein